MANRPMLFRNPAGFSGLRQNLASFIASLTQFIHARVQLAAQESKGAFKHLIIMVASLVAAGVLLLFGYISFVAFAVAGLAHLFGISWIWTALIIAILHFGGAGLCLIIGRAQLKHPMFRETSAVLKEDTEWLKNLDQKNRP